MISIRWNCFPKRRGKTHFNYYNLFPCRNNTSIVILRTLIVRAKRSWRRRPRYTLLFVWNRDVQPSPDGEYIAASRLAHVTFICVRRTRAYSLSTASQFPSNCTIFYCLTYYTSTTVHAHLSAGYYNTPSSAECNKNYIRVPAQYNTRAVCRRVAFFFLFFKSNFSPLQRQ